MSTMKFIEGAVTPGAGVGAGAAPPNYGMARELGSTRELGMVIWVVEEGRRAFSVMMPTPSAGMIRWTNLGTHCVGKRQLLRVAVWKAESTTHPFRREECRIGETTTLAWT